MNQSSPLDDHRGFVTQHHSKGVPPRHIASLLGKMGVQTSEKSVRRALTRWGQLEATRKTSTPGREPNFVLKGDEAEILTPPSPSLAHPDDLLEERGLSTDEWEVTNLTVNEWDSPTGETLKQLKVSAKRKKPHVWVYPASDGPSYRVEKTAKFRGRTDYPKLVVFVGDQQAPYHDEKLHSLFCDFLDHQRPDEGVLIGDTVDFPDISRHRSNPEWHVTVQECVNSGYLLLRDYVQSAEDTKWIKLCGNHDERIRNRLIDLMTGLYGLTPAEIPGEGPPLPAYSIRNLLHLDDLGIEYEDPEGGYADAQVKVSPFLAARHGWLARAGSGLSALKTLEHLGYSVVVGHSHRQSLVHKTIHDIDGNPMTLAAAETGCMCRIAGGLGYAVAPDWTNGFATAAVYEDGSFKIDLGTYINEKLYWRDQRYA